MSVDRADLLAVAARIAREAGELVARGARGHVQVAATKTSGTDVVTEVDRACEELIRRRLDELRPGDAVLGEEEGESVGGDTGVRWVVDPIDGTVNYLYGIPRYAVSIAAEVDGEAVAGVVLDAATGVEYAGTLGGGATRDGEPLALRPAAPLPESLVLTGFGYDPAMRAAQARAWVRLLPRVRDLRRMGSAALDLCMVAEGRADLYAEEGVNPWDHAAGGLIAREAGARTQLMRGVFGATLLACGPAATFDEFVDLLHETGLTAGR